MYDLDYYEDYDKNLLIEEITFLKSEIKELRELDQIKMIEQLHNRILEQDTIIEKLKGKLYEVSNPIISII